VQFVFPIKCPRETSLLGWFLLKMGRTIQSRRNMQEHPRRLRKGLISPNFWYLLTGAAVTSIGYGGQSISLTGHRIAAFLFVHLLTPPSSDKFRKIMEP
jgi:hypothetical protein